MQLFKNAPSRSYKTVANLEKAISYLEGKYRYIIVTDLDTGRFFPVFIGQEAVQAGLHFQWGVAG